MPDITITIPGCSCCDTVGGCCRFCNTLTYCMHWNLADAYMDALPSGPYTGNGRTLSVAALTPPASVPCSEGAGYSKAGGYYWEDIAIVPSVSLDLIQSPDGTLCYALIELISGEREPGVFGPFVKYQTTLLTGAIPGGYTTCAPFTIDVPCINYPSRTPMNVTITPGTC